MAYKDLIKGPDITEALKLVSQLEMELRTAQRKATIFTCSKCLHSASVDTLTQVAKVVGTGTYDYSHYDLDEYTNTFYTLKCPKCKHEFTHKDASFPIVKVNWS